jgi:hypothetical protein
MEMEQRTTGQGKRHRVIGIGVWFMGDGLGIQGKECDFLHCVS